MQIQIYIYIYLISKRPCLNFRNTLVTFPTVQWYLGPGAFETLCRVSASCKLLQDVEHLNNVEHIKYLEHNALIDSKLNFLSLVFLKRRNIHLMLLNHV